MKIINKTKGAISIFLVIIFLATYILAGLLVDGGRARMSRSLVEASTDNAANSILSYYNSLLYEMYGLFGVSKFQQDELEKEMKKYIAESISLSLEGDSDVNASLQNSVFFSLDLAKYFDGFDLKIEDIEVGSNINLRQKEVFDYQVVEQMKYRAPVQIAEVFLKRLEVLTEQKETADAVEDHQDRVEENKEVFEEGENILADIGNLKTRVTDYCNNPVDQSGLGLGSNLLSYIQRYDNRMGELFSDREYDDNKITDIANQYSNSMEDIKNNASEIHSTAESLLGRIDTYKSNMEQYISDLQAKRDNSDSDGVKSVYNQDISVAEDAMNMVIDQRDTIEKISMSSASLADADTSSLFDTLGQVTDQNRAELSKLVPPEDSEEDSEAAEVSITQIMLVEALYAGSGEAYNDYYLLLISSELPKLSDLANTLEIRHSTGDKEKAPEQKKGAAFDENEVSQFGDITKELIGIDQEIENKNNNDNTGSKTYNADSAGNKSDEAMGLLDKLENFGEDLRDNVYENEYIFSYFRNYVHHYRMSEDDTIGKKGYDYVTEEKFLQDDYRTLQHTVAEIEYIIAGNSSTEANLSEIYADILLWRTALNMISTFLTDGMYAKALSACSAAGPWAPLLAILALLVYSIAQGIYDTYQIMQGKMMYIIRTDWDEWFTDPSDDTSEFTLMGYSDYLRLFLLFEDKNTKLDRMQNMIQLNMRKVDSEFLLMNTYVNIHTKVTYSMKYLFMTDAIVPDGMRQDGRFTDTVLSNISY